MKKQIKKLNLSRITISNLENIDMIHKIGGKPTKAKNCHTDEFSCNTFIGICTMGCTLSCEACTGFIC